MAKKYLVAFKRTIFGTRIIPGTTYISSKVVEASSKTEILDLFEIWDKNAPKDHGSQETDVLAITELD